MISNVAYGGLTFISYKDTSLPVQVAHAGLEKQTSASYYFDCANRNGGSYLYQYTLSGEGAFKQGGETYRMTAGTSFLISLPGEFTYYLPADSENWEFVYIIFYGSDAAFFYDKIIGAEGYVGRFAPDSRPINLLLYMIKEAQSGNGNAYVFSGLTYQFLTELCRASLQKEKVPYSERVQFAIAHMQRNYQTLYSVDDVARALRVSKNHFIREFTKEVGYPPGKHLAKIRMQEATNLLLNTFLSVDEIAKQCGYSCGNYFCKVFVKCMNITPSAFRKLKLFYPSTLISLQEG